MQQENTPFDGEAPAAEATHRLPRAGFRMAFVGGLLALVALFLPEWRASGVGSSVVQQAFEELTAPRTPNCIDRCGGGALLLGYVFLVVMWIVVLLVTTAFRYSCPTRTKPLAVWRRLSYFLG